MYKLLCILTYRKKFNIILGMYHDQVLTPIKTIKEYDAINITIGLPFLRVTPDHGPNYEMFKMNKSSPDSLIQAFSFLKKSNKGQEVQVEPEKILYQSSNRLKGKNAIIIGGGKGIGKAIATRFAAEGAKIIINSRSKTDLDNVKKEIQNNKGECSCFVGDITDLKTIQNL